MKYAKLIDGVIEIAPKNKGSIINYDLDIEQLIADGYKEFYEIERPETSRLYTIGYEETENTITEIIVWQETEEEWEKRIRRQSILAQLEEIDKKRVRAICEPSQKDEHGTWLDYYNAIAQTLRQELEELN